jgi:hypothetical protein
MGLVNEKHDFISTDDANPVTEGWDLCNMSQIESWAAVSRHPAFLLLHIQGCQELFSIITQGSFIEFRLHLEI